MKWKVLLSEYRLAVVLVCLTVVAYMAAQNCLQVAPRITGVNPHGATVSARMHEVIQQTAMSESQRAFFDVQSHVLHTMERYILGMAPPLFIASLVVFGLCFTLFVQRIRRKIFRRRDDPEEVAKAGTSLPKALLTQWRMGLIALGLVALTIMTANNYFVMVPRLTEVPSRQVLWSTELQSLAPRALTSDAQWAIFNTQNQALLTLETYLHTLALPFFLPSAAGALLAIAIFLSRVRSALDASKAATPAEKMTPPEMPA